MNIIKESFWSVKIIKILMIILILFHCTLQAQTLAPPPEVSIVDDAGVNLFSGYPDFSLQDVKIGNGSNSLSHVIATYNGFFWGFRDNYDLSASITGSDYNLFRTVVVGNKSQKFSVKSGSLFDFATYEPVKNDGATLVQHNNFHYTYTDAKGVVAEIGSQEEGGPYGGKITYPNGFEVTVIRRDNRKESVNTNTGLQLKYFYKLNSLPDNPTDDQRADFFHPSSVVAINNAFEYCSPIKNSCSFEYNWPIVSYIWPLDDDVWSDDGTASGVFKVIGPEGEVTTYKHESFGVNPLGYGPPYVPRITEVKATTSHGAATSTYVYANNLWCPGPDFFNDCQIVNNNVVAIAKVGSKKWTYDYTNPDATYVGFGQSSGPNGTASVTFNNGSHLAPLTRVDDSVKGVTLQFYQDNRNKVRRAVVKGKDLNYVYDTRGNLIKTTQIGASSSAEAGESIVQTAKYKEECNEDNRKLCNKPIWVKDASGNQTDYSYYDKTGQIKSVTLPPAPDGVRPKVFYKYEYHYAWYKGAAGNYVRAQTPVSLISEKITCANGPMMDGVCANESDTIKTRYIYGPDHGPNNLWLRGVEHMADGETRRTCYAYDYYGNIVSEWAPKAGLESCQ